MTNGKIDSAVVTDATLEVGYYNCFGTKYAQHTFGHATKGAEKVWFDCYGGHGSNKGRVFPAEFRKPVFWRSRSHTGVFRVDVNLALARGICCGDPFDKRTVYDHKTGGKLPFWYPMGDCSGLVYGITGVCHQMCSRIAMSSGNGTKSLINRPPSFEKTYFLYGYWGGPDGIVGGTAMILVRYVERLLSAESEKERDEIRNSMRNQLMADLEGHLKSAYAPESRRPFVEEMVELLSVEERKGQERIDEILTALDNRLQGAKKEADLLLLEGSITTDQYARAINSAAQGFFSRAREALDDLGGEDWFETTFGFDPDMPGAADIIRVEEMMEREAYRELGKALRQL